MTWPNLSEDFFNQWGVRTTITAHARVVYVIHEDEFA